MTSATHIGPAASAGRPNLVAGIGWALVILALAALGYELLMAAASGSYRMLATGELWFELHVGSLNLSQAVIQRYVHPALWDPVAAGVLQWPPWSLLGAPGAFLVVLAQGRAR